MASASEIESYKGDSALAGGYGDKGTQQVISGVWKMADAVNESFALLRAQQFQKSQAEYQQKIKDRDELGRMITNNELNVDKLSDEDRIQANKQVSDLRSQLIDASKNGKLSDTDTFLELKKRYAEITDGINNKNVNNIAFEADQKKYANQYDENYEKHQAKEKELIAKDPNHKYQPYVPLFQYDDKKVYTPIVTDKVQKPIDKFQVETTETPNIAKTFDDTGAFFVTPNGRKEIMSAHAQLLNGSETSSILLDNANKKLEEIALTLPEDQRALLKPIDLAVDNPAMVIAKMRTAMGWSKVDTKPKVTFIDEQRAKAWNDAQVTEGNIRQNEASAKNARELAILNSNLNKDEARLNATLTRETKRLEQIGEKGQDGVDGKDATINEDNFPNIYKAQNDLKTSISNRSLLTTKDISTKEVKNLVDNVAKKSNIKIPIGSKLYKVDVADLPTPIKAKFKGLGAEEVTMVEGDDGFNIYVTDDYKAYSEYDLLRLSTGESKGAKEEWNKIDRVNASKQPQVEKTNIKKPEWTGEFDSKGNMIFK